MTLRLKVPSCPFELLKSDVFIPGFLVPGCQGFGGLQVNYHVKVVITQEDPLLDQQKGETCGIPQDPCFLFPGLIFRDGCMEDRRNQESCGQCLGVASPWDGKSQVLFGQTLPRCLLGNSLLPFLLTW